MQKIHHHYSHKHRYVALASIRKIDPTMTLGLRNRFVRDMNKRFNALKAAIRKTIVDNDALGIKRKATRMDVQSAPPGSFDFPKSSDKIQAFMQWLKDQEDQGILQIIQKPGIGGISEVPWTDTYIQIAYQHGVQKADTQLNQVGISMPTGSITGVFDQPIHADRIQTLFTRTFSDLTGITDAMDAQISRVLSEGLLLGGSVDQIAQNIVDAVDGIGINRARTLARTEIVRADHLASIAEMRRAGLNNVTVLAEYVTATDPCPECEPYDGKIMSLDEAEGLIPQHPNSYSDDTQIYTYDGWKPVSEMRIGDKCLSLNPANFQLDYQKVIRTFQHKEREMIQFYGRDFDLLVTKNHQIFYTQGELGKFWQLIEASKVPDDCYLFNLNEENMFTASQPFTDTLINPKRIIVPYNRMTYCVELPEWHTLLVRRNGKVTWSGNCRCDIKPYVEGMEE